MYPLQCWILFRMLTSVYEAATHNAQENCQTKNLEFVPLWFLYSIVTMNGLLVCLYFPYFVSHFVCYFKVVNASSNIWIYLSFGQTFRVTLFNRFGIICYIKQKTKFSSAKYHFMIFISTFYSLFYVTREWKNLCVVDTALQMRIVLNTIVDKWTTMCMVLWSS